MAMGSPPGAWMEIFRTLQAAEVWANHGAWVTETRPALGPGVKERFEWAATVTPDDVAANQAKRDAVIEQLDAVLSPGDVLVLPTSPRVAPLKGTATDKIEIEYRYQAMCLLCIAGLGGLPQISLPLGTLDGLPLGLSLVGPRNADVQLLRLARRLMERAAGE